jgi:CDP-diacylglycerol--serine O-phosphatidyltransferase
MISSVPYGSLKGLRKGQGNRKKFLLLAGILALTFVSLQSAAPLAVMTVYVVSGLIRFDWEKWLSRETGEGERAEKKA